MSQSSKNPAGVPIPNMRRGIRAYFADIASEMRKVVWPTRKDTVRLTGLVLTVCGIFVVYLYIFGIIVEFVINFLVSGGNK